MPTSRATLTQVIGGIVSITLLAALSLWVLQPFLLALTWAAAIVVATWPALLALQARLRGRRRPAAALMTLALVFALVMPLVLLIGTVSAESEAIAQLLRSVQAFKLPAPPQWLVQLPFVGERLAALWREIGGTGWSALTPYLGRVGTWAVGHLSGIGHALVQVGLTIVISAILYLQGDAAARGVRLFFQRIGGARAVRSTVLAAQAVRAVAIGVVGTALLQSLLGGAGLLIAGVPLPVPLTFLMFVLCLAQIGPLPVLIPVIAWLYVHDRSVAGTLLVVFAVLAVTLDNVIRPLLIRQGAEMPLLLVFAGVIGGLLSIGLLGLFIGPVVLAVTYRLLEEWVLDSAPPPAA